MKKFNMQLLVEKPTLPQPYVLCSGIGYPMWKKTLFQVKSVFLDGNLLLSTGVSVSAEDFKQYNGCLGELTDEIKNKISTKGFHSFESELEFTEPKIVNPVWYLNQCNPWSYKNFQKQFKNYYVVGIYSNGKSLIVLTDDQIIIVNNKYDEPTWGDLNGNFRHVYLEINNIESVHEFEGQIMISSEQYELNFPLRTKKECDVFVEQFNVLKQFINQKQKHEFIQN